MRALFVKEIVARASAVIHPPAVSRVSRHGQQPGHVS